MKQRLQVALAAIGIVAMVFRSQFRNAEEKQVFPAKPR